MKLQNITSLLQQNTYPGRGILFGLTADGSHALLAYFIMGRSVNSRNRVFTPRGAGIITEAADPAQMTDPSLIIYAPVDKVGADTVVTNGDQTDTVCDYLRRGGSFEDALRTRTFEPDSPNFTPRISGIATVENGAFSYKLAILKSAGGNENSLERHFWEYPQPLPGQGRLLHTYNCDGDPIPSFEGEPTAVALDFAPAQLAPALWQALNSDNKVSLFVRSIRLSDGAEETWITNKHQKEN